MKAAVLEAVKKLSIKTDVPEPAIGPKDVLVRAKACGICGTDVHIWEGDFFPTFPLIPGHELAGEVVRVGEEVTGLAPGDRVAVDPTVTCEECHFCMINRQNHCLRWNAVGVTRDGGFAELVRVPVKNCYRFEKVGFGEAAFCEPLACVVFGQDRAKIDIGSQVLIVGAGPIGQLHLQCSRANGAYRRHVNVLRGDDNERAGGSCVCVDERVGRDFDLVERVYDLGRCVEAAAVRVHVENDGGSVVALGCFDRPPQKRQQRRCDFTMQGHHDDVAFLNGFARGSRCSNAKDKREAYADGKHLHLSS